MSGERWGNDAINGLLVDPQKKIGAQVAHLIEDEMTLHDQHRAHELTQVHMAKPLHISQDGVSRLCRQHPAHETWPGWQEWSMPGPPC